MVKNGNRIKDLFFIFGFHIFNIKYLKDRTTEREREEGKVGRKERESACFYSLVHSPDA